MLDCCLLGGVVPDPCHSKYKVTDSLVDEFCLDTSIPDIQWMLCMPSILKLIKCSTEAQ